MDKSATTIVFKNKVLILGFGSIGQATYPNIIEIPLAMALDKDQLAKQIMPDDCVAVFGASHSAILTRKNLLSLGTSVINFYHTDWINLNSTHFNAND